MQPKIAAFLLNLRNRLNVGVRGLCEGNYAPYTVNIGTKDVKAGMPR